MRPHERISQKRRRRERTPAILRGEPGNCLSRPKPPRLTAGVKAGAGHEFWRPLQMAIVGTRYKRVPARMCGARAGACSPSVGSGPARRCRAAPSAASASAYENARPPREQHRADISRRRACWRNYQVAREQRRLRESAPIAERPRPRRGPYTRSPLTIMVGVRGFEPPAPSSRTRCATRLRYTPTAPRTAQAGLIEAPRAPRKRDGGAIRRALPPHARLPT